MQMTKINQKQIIVSPSIRVKISKATISMVLLAKQMVSWKMLTTIRMHFMDFPHVLILI
jgi:hypothetical protein